MWPIALVVAWSVCLLATTMNPAKTAELIWVPFGMGTSGSYMDRLDAPAALIPPGRRGILEGWALWLGASKFTVATCCVFCLETIGDDTNCRRCWMSMSQLSGA